MCVAYNTTNVQKTRGIRDDYDSNGEIKIVSHGFEGRIHDIIDIIY